MRYLVNATLLLLALPCAVSAQRPAATIGADPAARVTITNSSGSINVRVCAGNEATVFGDRSMMRDMNIDTSDKRNNKFSMDAGHDLEVCVPRRAQLRAQSGSGNVHVEGVEGTVDIESGSGSLQVTGRPRSIHAMGFSGDVTIRGGATDVTRAESVSGNVSVTQATGVVEAKSSSGGVRVTGEVRDAQLFSVSGPVTFAGTVSSRLSAESSSGPVELTLPRNTSANYELSTITADIENNFGPAATRARHGAGVNLSFSVGSGRARIKAASVSGSVTLQDR